MKSILDKFYKEYDFKNRVVRDPIEFPHKYKKRDDIETAGFIASCFAYGRVDLFKPVINALLSKMGKSPYDFLLSFNLSKHRSLFSGVKYRFNKSDDIIALFYALHKMLKKFGSIESVFKLHYRHEDSNTGNGLVGLVKTILNTNISPVYRKDIKPYGFIQFFPSPEKGSACKRMNLFLRWMIRDRDIDFGIWHGIPKNKLVIPLDTHIARIGRCLGFTKRASQDWKMAVEITEALKQFDSEDPLKYDFALCHQGISKFCSKIHCKNCSLFLKRSAEEDCNLFL